MKIILDLLLVKETKNAIENKQIIDFYFYESMECEMNM